MKPRSAQSLPASAASLPILLGCVRLGWCWVLLGGAAASLCLRWIGPRRQFYSENVPDPNHELLSRPDQAPRRSERFLAAAAAPGLLLLGAASARWAAASFPQTENSPVAALLLLGLAALAAEQGAQKLSRCAAVLLRLQLLLLGTVLLFSLPELRLRHLRPEPRPREALTAFVLLLLPGLRIWLPAGGEDERPERLCLLLTLLAAAAAAVTAGVLSPALARRSGSFSTLAKGVSVLGVMRRFEALAYAGLEMGGFCLIALFLCCLRAALLRSGVRRPEGCFRLCLGAAAALRFVQFTGAAPVLLLCGAIFCVLLPNLNQGIVLRKTFKKSKKR